MNTLIELKELGTIKIEGPDAEKFLQGQLTCDVQEVTEQQSRLGAHCDHKGRMQATFRLFKYQNSYHLQIPKNLITHLLTTLKKYAVFSKVTLNDVSQDWQQLGISGHDAIAQKLPEKIDDVIIDHEIIIIRIPGNTPRFCLSGSSQTITAAKQRLLPHCQTKDYSYWQLLDIEAGIPSLFPETIGLFTPQQINYTAINGVSFNKGCYTGQEIVARMHYLGKLKQHMYQITFTAETEIKPGANIITQTDKQTQECGTLVQAVRTHENQWLGLAAIYDNVIGQTLYMENLQQPILAVKDLSYTTHNS